MSTSEPPASEVASPSEDTVMSMREPLPTKAGSSAVTMTAAMLRVRALELRTLMPMRSSIDCSDCSVNGELRRRVAGAVEADHQAVADELVGAHALHRDDVLDARAAAPDGRQQAQRQREQEPARSWTGQTDRPVRRDRPLDDIAAVECSAD